MVVPQAPGENTPEKIEAAELLLNVLSPAQRDAVVLCIMEGLSHGDAAELLGISVNAVDQRLCRARRLMQDAAEEASRILNFE